MSHVVTATFTNDDGTAINVPTAGVTQDEPIDAREALDILLKRGWTPIPFASEKEAINAAERASEAWPHTHPLQSNWERIQSFLEPLRMGFRSTMDAAQEDFDLIKQGRAPRQAIKAGGQVISALGNPAINPTIPALQYTRKVFDPQTGWQTINKVYPGGDWFSIFARMGGFGDPIARLLAAFERGQTDLSPGLKK